MSINSLKLVNNYFLAKQKLSQNQRKRTTNEQTTSQMDY